MEQVVNSCTACPSYLYNNCQNDFGPEYVNDGDQGGCGFLGFGCQLKCRWTGYSASASDCCLNNPTGQRTCDPNYNRGNASCDTAMQQHCSIGDNVMSDQKCQDWCNQRPDACRATKLAYCSTNLDKATCRTWCNDDANYESCATAVQPYCELHPTDIYCSCINSRVVSANLGVNPKCVDQTCLASGFLTQNMRTTACPSNINCTVQAAAQNSGISLITNIPIQQNCGASATTAVTTPPPSASSGLQIYYILIFIFIVFIAILLYAVSGKFVGLR